MACEDFSLCANLWGGPDWGDGAGRSPELCRLRGGDRDSGSILLGDLGLRDCRSRTHYVRLQIDVPSLSDEEGAAQFDLAGYADRDFAPTLDVDRLASDLKPIPDSDIPQDLGLLADDSVLGHGFGARDDSRRGDIYIPCAVFQNIYLPELAVWRE
jgi:hypothetical protein